MKKISLLAILGFCLSVWIAIPGMTAEPIKIAAILSETGIGAPSNHPSSRWLNFLVEKTNQQGGVLGRPLKLIALDNKSTALGSKQAAVEAVKQDVVGVIGAIWSSHSLGMAPVLQNAGIPMISPASTNPKVTLVGDYIFRACYTDPFQGKIMATFAQRDLGAKTAVVLKNINSDYSIDLAAFFTRTANQIGLKVLWEGKYREKDVDFSAILKETQHLQPDVIFIPGYPRDSGLLMKQARRMGITDAVFVGADGWSTVTEMFKFGGTSVEGAYYSSHWHQDVPLQKGRHLQTEFSRKYGMEVSSAVVLTYDALMMYIDAIEHTKSLDHKKIKDALAATMAFEGATGTITFDENGDPVDKDAVILKLERGKSVFVKSIKP